MADPDHVAQLAKGADLWNQWRKTESGQRPDLSDESFYSASGESGLVILPEFLGFDFSRCDLNRTSLRNCIFQDCDFSHSSLHFADLVDSYHCRCSFRGTGLNVSKIGSAEFISCDFTDAELSYCTAEETSFIGSKLIRTKMDNMSLVKTDLSNTEIDGAMVYGTSAWDLKLDGSSQQNIYISDANLTITVPNIELAQFIAMLVTNSKIREIIDTITSKVVLILGRFTQSRKEVLDRIKCELQNYGYVPVLFDFMGPQSRDLTETIIALASMSKFVVADLSEAKSVPQELSSFVPHFPSIPVQPIIQRTAKPYGMFEHFERYPWVLDKIGYSDHSIPDLVKSIVKNCEERRAIET